MVSIFTNILIAAFLFISVLTQSCFTQAQEAEQIEVKTLTHTYLIENNPKIELSSLDIELIGSESTNQYNELKEFEKTLFEQNRIYYLNKIAQVLENKNLVLGSFVKSSQFIKKITHRLKNTPQLPEGEIGLIVRRMLEEERQRIELESDINEKKSIETAGKEAIQIILNALNKTMYTQARLMANSNEFGFTFSVGLGAHLGIGKKVLGGVGRVVFNFGFNREKKIAVFELGLSLERTIRAITPIFLAAIDINGGLYLKNSNTSLIKKGTSLVAPAVPIATSIYPSHFEVVGNTGFGFPPIINEFMGYIASGYRLPIIRLEISFEPRLKIKVRFKSNKSVRCEALLAI